MKLVRDMQKTLGKDLIPHSIRSISDDLCDLVGYGNRAVFQTRTHLLVVWWGQL